MFASGRWARWLVAMALGLFAGGSTAVRLADVADDDSIEITRDPRLQLVAPAEASTGVRIFQLAAGQLSGNLVLDARVVSRKSTVTLVEFLDSGNALLGTGTLQSGGTNKDGIYRYTWLSRPIGSSTIRIRATNAVGQKETIGPLTIVVNRPPTVTLTTPSAASTIVTAPTSIALSATTSEDAGDAVTQVQFLRKPSGAPVTSYTVIQTITATAGQNVFNGSWSVDNTDGGVYDITARATDSFLGSNDAASKSVTVCASVSPTITAPTASQVFQLGSTGGTTSVTLTATVTVPANCSLPSSLSFFSGTSVTAGTPIAGTPTATTAGQTRTFTQTWSSLGGGVYNVAARANYGTTTADTSTPVNFRVNRPPSAVLIASPSSQAVFAVPGYGQTITIPVTLTATENLDAGDGITKLEVFQDGSATASATQTFTPTAGVQTTSGMSIAGVGYVTGTTTGARSLTSRATDNFGGTLNTASATPITVGYALSANNSTLPHGGFETPRLGTSNVLVSGPTGSAWTFTGEAGMRADTTGLVAPEPNPPVVGQTPQMGYLRCGTGLTTGAMTQAVVPQTFTQGSQTRPYKLKLKGAYDSTGAQQIKVTVTDLAAATSFSEVLTPTSSSAFIQLTTVGTFDLTAGKAYALKLEPNTCTDTRIAYVDDVQLEVQSAPATVVMAPGSVPARIQLLNPTTPSITPQATVGDPDNPSGTVNVGFFYQQTAPSAGPETRIGTADVTVTLSAGSAAVTGIAWTPSAGGTYDVYAKAYDQFQLTPTIASPRLSVVVNAPPNAPSLSITAPAAGAAAVIKGANVTVSATATDPNGTPDIKSLRFVRPGSADVVTTTTTGTATASYTAIAGTAPSTATTATTGAEAAQTTTFTAYAKDADGREGPASNAVNLLICKEPDITVTGPGSGGTATSNPTYVVTDGATFANLPIAASATTGSIACGTVPTFSVARLINGVETAITPAPTITVGASQTTLSTAAQTFATGQTHTLRFRATSNAQSALIPARSQVFDYRFDVIANLGPHVGGAANTTATNGSRAVVGVPYTLRVPVVDSGPVTLAVTGVTGASTSCAGAGTQNCDVTWTPTAPGLQTISVAVTDSSGASTSTRTTVAVQQAPAADSMANLPTADAPVDALVGKVAGSFSVSEGGSAGYSIPIQVPPGVNGLQPGLALGYSSSGSYGMMGIGWSVSGLGAITRCPNTIAQDGFRAPVNYDNQDTNDAYCLGGQRLVAVSNLVSAGNVTLTYNPPTNVTITVAAEKQEFRTEIESYSRITGFKEWPNFTKGFSRFIVETKDGRVMHYSSRFKPTTNGYDTCAVVIAGQPQPLSCTNGVLANRVKTYVLDRVEDMAGNRMDIEYHTTRPTNTSETTYVVDWDAIGSAAGVTLQAVGGNGSYPPTEILPKVIKYASGQEVRFTYDEHPLTAQLRSFDSGAGEGVITQRLTGIESWADGVLVKRYALGYDTNTLPVTSPPTLPVSLSHTGRTRLISVKECYGATDTTCLPATTFQWQGAAVSALSTLQSPVNENSYTFLGSRQLIGDIRGNGRSSLILTDFHDDGGFPVAHPGIINSHIRVCELAGATTSAAGVFSCADQYIQDRGLTNTEQNVYLADVNGDGKADLIYGQPDTGIHYVCLANADGSGFSNNLAAPTPCNLVALSRTVNNGLLQGDFDGDGRIDILAYRDVRDYSLSAADGTLRHKFDLYRGTAAGSFAYTNTFYFAASPKEQSQGSLDQGDLRKRFFVADYNGDGSADLMQRMIGVGGNTGLDQWRVCYSRSDNSVRFDCPRDIQTVVAGTGVSSPPPLMQVNAPYQCSIPQSVLPAGGAVSWKLNYQVTNYGYFVTSTSRADVPDNGTCSSASQITWPYDLGDGNTYPGAFGNNAPTACNNGINLSLLTGGDSNYPAAGTLGQQTITVTRTPGSSYTGDIVVSHVPLSGTGITGFTDLPAGVSCSQARPASVTGPNPAKAEEMILADFNGDGLADIATPVDTNTKANGNWQVCLSTGDGGFERFTSVGARTSTCKTISGLLFANGDAVTTGDFDGDGRADLLAWQKAEDGNQGWQIAYSRGAKSAYNAVADSVSFSVVSGLPIAGLANPTPNVAKISRDARIGDFNGDGISDLSLRVSEGGPMRVLSPGALDGTTSGARQEMIIRITDGLGAATEIDYAPITDSSVYTKTPTIANTTLAAGELDAQSPMQVVKAVRADNGLNCTQGTVDCEWHTTSFKYYGLRATTNGRGLLGFSQRDVTESFGAYIGSTSKTAYNNELAKWWLAGSPRQIVKTHPNALEASKRLSDTMLTYHPPRSTNGINASASLKILEVFGAGSIQSAWDLNGSVLPSQSSSTASWDSTVVGAGNEGYDLDGNVLRTSATTTFGTQTHTKSSLNTYGFRSVTTTGASIARGEWILGRLTRSEVTHSKSGTVANGGGDIKRVSAFTYYDASNANCNIGTGNGSTDPSALVATAPKGYVCDELVEPDSGTAGDQTLWSSTRHRYDAFGNRVTSTVSYKAPLAQGDQTGFTAALTRSLGSVTFDAKGRFATTATNALSDSETRSFNPMFGGIATLVGPNGLLTESTFDAFGRKIRERSFAGSTTADAVVSDASTLTQWCTQTEPISSLVNAAACNPGETHRKRIRASGGAVSFTFYDRLQREVRNKTQAYLNSTAAISATADQWAEATVTYDVRGRKASISKPAGDGTATTSYLFDDLERVTNETLVGNHGANLTPAVPTITAVTDTSYNGLISTVTRKKASTDPTDRTDQITTRETDSQGKLLKVTDAASGITTFTHDAVGNLLSVTAPTTVSGVTESMTYDVRGRKTGLTSLQAGNYVYAYNGLGELIRQVDGRSWVTVNSYDLLGRVIQRDEREGSSSTAPTFKTVWTYDSGSFCGARTRGKLCTVAVGKSGYFGEGPERLNGPSSEARHTYDVAGRLERTESAMNLSVPVTQGDPASGPKRFTSSTYYDTNGRAQLMGTAGGVVFRNHYALWGGSAWKVTDPADSLTYWQSTGRFADGQSKSTTSGGAGSVITAKTLDGLGRIDTIKTGTTGNPTLIQNANYDIDSFGNLVSRIDTPNGLTITAAETYQYDALNRVTGKNGVANSVATYDAIGNFASKAGQAGAYAYDATSKRLGSYAGRAYAYDGNGNVTGDGLRTLGYTPWSLPWSVALGSNSMKWDYDHGHARSAERSTIHGTTFLAPGFELVVPTESAPANPKTIERTFIPTPDGVIGVLTRSSSGSANAAEAVINKTDYWHKDHLGSLVAMTDQTGTITQRFRFDPWGKRQCLTAAGASSTCSSNGSSGTEERGFTGHEMLDEIGLIHMNGRLYDPELGRFLEADPVIQNPLDGQNYNRYSYVGNNPLSYTDPSGFSRWTKWRRPLFSLVAAIAVPWAVGELLMANATFGGALAEIGSAEIISLTSSGQAIANVAGGMAAGGVSGGNVQSAVIGAVTAGLQFGVGQALGHSTPSVFSGGAGTVTALQKMAAHAAIGCASAAASGGSCKAGAASSGFSSLAGPSLPGADAEGFHSGNFLGRIAVGAVASKLAGGAAEQGALLAAMEYLYNQVGGRRASTRTEPTTENILARQQIRQYLEEAYGPNATTLEPANWQPTSRDFTNLRAVHGNSSLSLREQHLYEIWDTRDDSLYKIGVSGRPLNLNGSSGRANSQVNALNRGVGENVFEAVVVRPCVPCRADVLRMEQNGVRSYMNLNQGQRPPGNLRP